MRTHLYLFLFALSIRFCMGADFVQINPEAERLSAEKSFARAYELYSKMDVGPMSPEARRWVAFRKADLQWRGAIEKGDETGETQVKDAARQLEELVRGRERREEQDRVWAEANESLGMIPPHFFDERGESQDNRWRALQRALDWWAASRDLELARDRYLRIARAIFNDRHDLQYIAGSEVLENAARIAASDDDKAWAHYRLALVLSARGQPVEYDRARSAFEAVIAIGKKSEWYDDALNACAQWMMHAGRVKWDEAGNAMPQPDRKRALELWRKLTSEFGERETPYYRQARMQMDQITRAELTLSAGSIFFPGSKIELDLNFQNVRQVEFTLRKVDLLRDFKMWDDRNSGSFGAALAGADGEVLKRWSRDFSAKEEYDRHHELIAVEEKLGAGSYLLEATGGGKTAREFIAVSDVALVIQSASDRIIAFVCDAEKGKSIEGADVKVWNLFRNQANTWTTQRTGRTGADGLVEFAAEEEGERKGNVTSMVALASVDGKPAFATPWPVRAYRNNGREWRLYTVTDRPAYRPGETVHWKTTARRMNGETYSTPVGEKLRYEIHDARRTKVKEGEVTFNSFGSAWGDLEVTAEMALGVFHIQFYEGNNHVATAGNFRLEEYKLPEFKVAVKTPEENGRPKTFRLGEKVDVSIKADYYFGGAVSDAAVKVVVRKQGYYRIWKQPRDYPWFYADHEQMRPWRRHQGEVLFEKDLRTDAEGQATFSIETANFGGEDLEFGIEARVTDASRREIVGSGSIKVTRHKYRVHAHANHSLHRPGDKVTVEFVARDANETPVSATAKIHVTREMWTEKDGAREYEREPITTSEIKTDAEGKASFDFAPQKEGYYRIVWLSETDGRSGPPIRAEETVWVLTSRTTQLGYRRGSLEILLDKDTFRAGQRASLMLHTPQADRWVLLTTGSDRMLHRQVVHLEGDVKLIELEIGEQHVPNFYIHAVMISAGEIHTDQKEIVVPPVKHFLTVDVKPGRDEFKVRDTGEYIIRTLDHEGKPVAAEVSFGVVDESVFYIQEDTARDPRQFFFGTRRYNHIQTVSTFQSRSYRKEKKEGQAWFNERDEPRADTGGRFDNYYSRDARAARPGGMAGGALATKTLADMSLGMQLAPAAAAAEIAGDAEAPGEEPLVRSDFRSTVFWQPDVKTDADGTAVVKVVFPDATTSWKGTARAATAGNQFGVGDETVRTTQPLIVRLQAPRFFIVGDEVTISAVINNNTSSAINVTPKLEVKGLRLLDSAKAVTVAAKGEARVDWRVLAETMGEAAIKVSGRSSEASDAMERKYPVYEHGIEKFITAAGTLTANEARVTLDLPAARKKGSTKFVVQATPSLAVTMLDALPYLLEYPYGCVEQTMSRFLPAAIVARTLREAGLDPEDVMTRAFGGIEKPKSKKNMERLDEIVAAGLQRISEMRHADGGWGWWAEGESDTWMTAYVVWGLTLAGEAGRDVPAGLIEGGVEFLRNRVLEAENAIDSQAWQLHGLAVARARGQALVQSEQKALANLWAKRESLSAYSRALFALAAHHLGDKEKAAALVRNLENSVLKDEGIAHWGKARGWWRWSDGPVESTAFALRALMTIDPKNALIEPAVNWMIKNRRGAQWSNTRDTAISLLALTDYLKASGELKPEVEFDILANGERIASRKVSGADVFAAPSRFEVSNVRDGANEIRVVRKGGSSRIYFSAEAVFFSLEEPITPAANEIIGKRQYFKLVPYDTLLKGKEYERVLLRDGESVKSGDRIEVALLLESKNDYEYLVFEDLKPGGFEAVEIRSGEAAYARQVRTEAVKRGGLFEPEDYTGDSRWVYKEMRDRKVASFVDRMPQGFWELRYEFRAEAPGKFHALPMLGHAMYVPEIRCNTSEARVEVLP